MKRDFLAPSTERFDYIVGNPPYVSITALTEDERRQYRRTFPGIHGRFDLYLLFFERALDLLSPGGRLVFITPEKYLYVQAAQHLRSRLAALRISEIELVSEQTFGHLVTYPTITMVENAVPRTATRVHLRDGTERRADLAGVAASWLPRIHGHDSSEDGPTLAEVCLRISCGVATGADSVFVVTADELTPGLRRYARPTISGRDIRATHAPSSPQWLLLPYDAEGGLLPEGELGELSRYLKRPDRRAKLLARTCVQRKPWYSFHETPPLLDLLRPKLLCKDIVARPFFAVDRVGAIVPRHSVYYVIPKNPKHLLILATYLNSSEAASWLSANCQRAANGFLRLQSHVLKRMPIPVGLLD